MRKMIFPKSLIQKTDYFKDKFLYKSSNGASLN